MFVTERKLCSLAVSCGSPMQHRLTNRVRRTFDTRRDTLSERGGGGWIPLSRELADSRHARDVAASVVKAPAQASHVLVIDNDRRAADFLELLLHAGGYSQTRVAYSAHGALAIAREFSPAIVLMELDLLDMGSYELGQALKGRAQVQRVRLIAVTSSRVQEGRESARKAGFERYLLKPIVAADLGACLAP